MISAPCMLVSILACMIAESTASQTKNVDITTVIQNHFAETTLSSDVLNDANYSKEVGFQVMLPKEAFITHFEMTIDHVTYEGVIKEKRKAKKLFTEAKKRGKTAGLVETTENADKLFSTSVNVAAGTLVHFKLVYQQLLRKTRGKFRNKVILFGDQFSEFLTMNVYICESRAIKNVTVPAILTAGGTTVKPNVEITVLGKSAHVQFLNDNNDMMRSLASEGGGFIVEYELKSSKQKADVVVNDGYFLYFGPDMKAASRRIVFVLDVSGSMGGLKLQQMKQAMHNILDKMTTLDRIGIIKFSSGHRKWKNNIMEARPARILSAKEFMDGEDELGGTHIWGATEAALDMLKADMDKEEEPDPDHNFIVLLTDGQGSLSRDQFLDKTNVHNSRRAVGIHTISFGEFANNELLKAVSFINNGTWKQILVNLDSALQIENYVDDLGISPASGLPLVISYPDVISESFQVESKYGGEVMSVGKLSEVVDPRKRGPYEVSLQGFLEDGSTLQSEFYLDRNSVSKCGGMGKNKIRNFAKKAFGMVKVEKALKDHERAEDAEQKENFRQKAVNLSLSYNLVTPVTSLLVIKPEDEADIEESKKKEDTKTDKTKTSTNAAHTTTSSQAYTTTTAPSRPQWSMHGDPHFVARLTNDITVCFSWIGRDHEIVNLVNDARNSIVINGLIERDSDGDGTNSNKRLFVTKLAILLAKRELAIQIDPDGVTVQALYSPTKVDVKLHFALRNIKTYHFSWEDLSFEIQEVKGEHAILTITLSEAISIVVEVHYRTTKNERSRDHLDLAMPRYSGDSEISGLFGQLRRKNYLLGGGTRIVLDQRRNETFLIYNKDKVPVKKWRMKIPYLKSVVDCWLPKGHFRQLLGHKMRYFTLENLLDTPGIFKR